MKPSKNTHGNWAEILREAVRAAGKTQYRTAIDAGMGETQLARFMAGTHGLSLGTANRLGRSLGLTLDSGGTPR